MQLKHTLLLFVFLPSFVFAQEKKISGKVIDQQVGEPLPFATVSLKNAKDSTLLAASITNEAGIFQIETSTEGNCILEVNYLGFKKAYKTVYIGTLNNFLDVGEITLVEDATQLEEVVVQGKKATVSQKLDKKSFLLEDNIAQTGGSVLDALRALPSISVDQDGVVSLRGSNKVSVLIDGKQSALTGFGSQTALDNIPSSNIERIEIINNPSAKDNAIGSAGIINIVYKKNIDKGWHGEAGLSLGMGALGKRKDDLPTDLGSYTATGKVMPSIHLNYTGKKLSYFFQNSVLRQRKLPNNEFTTRTYSDGSVIYSQVAENRRQTHVISKMGLNWQMDENNRLSIAATHDIESHVDTSQVPFILASTQQRSRSYGWNEKEITGFINATANYEHLFPQAGHSLSFNTQFTKGWEDESYFLQDSSDVRQSFDTTMLLASEYTLNFSADYTKPLGSGSLGLGSKVQWRWIPVSYDLSTSLQSVYPNLGDFSRWGENIYAAYVNYIYEKPNVDIEAGLRTEYTDVFYNIAEENAYYPSNDAYDYLEFFPSVRLSYKINDKNKVSLFYNRRIDRPGEPELRIFPKFDDPELVKVGNPYLRPQFTQNFEIGYKRDYAQGYVYVSGFHKIINDQFLRVYAIDTVEKSGFSTNDLINKIYQNTGDATNTGVELIWNHKFKKYWTMSANFNYYLIKIKAHEGTMLFPYERSYSIASSSNDTWDMKINNYLQLPKSIKLQLTTIYYAKRNVPQGVQSARFSLDMGLSKGIWKGKGELTASATDIFNRFGIEQELTGENFTATYQNFFETQVFRLGFKYKF